MDREHGGFLCHCLPDSTRVSTKKRSWYQGRGLWLYAALYNRIEPDPRFLDIALDAARFIMRTAPRGDELRPEWFERDGTLIGGPETELYGDAYIAEGLAELSRIRGNEWARAAARDIVMKCVRIYDSRPGFGERADFWVSGYEETGSGPSVPRPRVPGYWMVLLRAATLLLERGTDQDLEAISRRCVNAVMEHHRTPACRLVCEYTNHDSSRIEGRGGREVTAHAIKVLWMVMEESLRRGDRSRFEEAAVMLKRHIVVLWDDVYGGLMLGYRDIEGAVADTTKALWVHAEALVGLLLVVQHTRQSWALTFFREIHRYLHDAFSLEASGSPLWIIYGPRVPSAAQQPSDRVDLYHHPRELVLNLERLQGMTGGTRSRAADA